MWSRFLWSKICYSLLTGEKLLTKVFIKIRSLIFIRLCFNMMPMKRFFLAPQNVSGPAQRQTDLRFLCLVKISGKIEVSNSFLYWMIFNNQLWKSRKLLYRLAFSSLNSPSIKSTDVRKESSLRIASRRRVGSKSRIFRNWRFTFFSISAWK